MYIYVENLPLSTVVKLEVNEVFFYFIKYCGVFLVEDVALSWSVSPNQDV